MELQGADTATIHNNNKDGDDTGFANPTVVSEDVTDSIINSAGQPNLFQNDDKAYQHLLLSSTYLEDAMEGRTLPYETDPISILRYRSYSNRYLQWVTIFFMWWNLCLAIFEVPAVPGAELPIWFTLVDMIIYIGMTSSGYKGLRVSRVFRPLFLVNMNESRQIRRTFRNVRNTVPNILSVLTLFFFNIALFALMAFKLFKDRKLIYRTGGAYFNTYWDSYWELYVLVTTANSPDVMMPAYDYSEGFAIFFISYILVNTYIFMNLFLAVIYNSYKMHLEREISNALKEKTRKLNMSFELIKTGSDDAEPVITFEKWCALVGSLQYKVARAKTLVIWHALHNDEISVGITRSQYLKAADLLNVSLVVDSTEDNIFAATCPSVFNSETSKLLVNVVHHQIFAWFFDLLIIANAVCIGFDKEKAEWFFLPVFLIELALRVYAVGPKEFFSLDRLWNWFDFFIIISAFIVTIVEASLDELDAFPREALDVLLVLRCLRLIKIVGNIQGFRVIVVTVVNIAPSLLTYAGVLVMVYYSFAIIGMDAFGDKIPRESVDESNCGVEALEGSEFQRMGYCRMNFNNILNSFVTLFVMMVVNQWHVITQGFVIMTSKAARLFFLTFHMIVVLLILNIIVAFVLEAFILEYTIRTNDMEDLVDDTITKLRETRESNMPTFENTEGQENTTYPVNSGQGSFENVNFKLRVNRGHKNIEVLLQRLFEAKYKIQSTASGITTIDGVDPTTSTS